MVVGQARDAARGLPRRRTMTRSNGLSFIAVVAISVVAISREALAAEPESASGAPSGTAAPVNPPRPDGRELAGHLFTPMRDFVGPFAATSFDAFVAIGGGSSHGSLTLQPPGNPQPPPQTFDGTVSYAAMGGLLDFEYRFLPGFSARLGLSETVYSGLDGPSAAVVGSNARLGGNLGITAGIPIGQSVRVAAVVDGEYAPRLGLILGPAVQSTFANCSQSVDKCRFALEQLFQQTNVFAFEPGVAAAWAPMRALGVTSNVSYAYASIATSNQATITQNGVSFGAGVDFDFMGISRVPVGLQVSWHPDRQSTLQGRSRCRCELGECRELHRAPLLLAGGHT